MAHSTYYVILKITNNLRSDLTSCVADLNAGIVSGPLVDVRVGTTTAEIRINDEYADAGVDGRLVYKYTAGAKERTVSFVFKCSNNTDTFAKIEADDPTILETKTSPYGSSDHPLRSISLYA